MDIFILIGSFTIVCLHGHAGRLRAGDRLDPGRPVGRHPARGRDAEGLRRHERLLAAGHPVLHPGRRHHGRRRHGRTARQSRQGVRRLHPRRHGAGQHPGLDHVRLHLGLVGRRYRRGRLGDDPADDQERLSAPVRRQRDDLGLAAAAAGAALAQHDHLFDRRRRHHLGGASVHGRHHPGAAAGPVAHHPRAHHRLSQRLPEGRGGAAAPGAQDRGRCDLGHGHDRDHPRRHPVRRLHADRGRRGRGASTRSSSPCSSIATSSGASCRS